MNTEFSSEALPLAVGSVRGVRAFSLREGGLFGAYQNAAWFPGENVARCPFCEQTQTAYLMPQTTYNTYQSGIFYPVPPSPMPMPIQVRLKRGAPITPSGPQYYSFVLEQPVTWNGVYHPVGTTVPQGAMITSMGQFLPPDHSIAECTHGFYAYFVDANPYDGADKLLAVIEGYGETMIGSKGFRATKAKILAVCMKPWFPEGSPEQVQAQYPDVRIFDNYKQMLREFPLTPEYAVKEEF